MSSQLLKFALIYTNEEANIFGFMLNFAKNNAVQSPPGKEKKVRLDRPVLRESLITKGDGE